MEVEPKHSPFLIYFDRDRPCGRLNPTPQKLGLESAEAAWDTVASLRAAYEKTYPSDNETGETTCFY